MNKTLKIGDLVKSAHPDMNRGLILEVTEFLPNNKIEFRAKVVSAFASDRHLMMGRTYLLNKELWVNLSEEESFSVRES